ncbi:MAG: hypothetical protein PHO86_01445 [Bacilli bacterium]|nr:hypothetical protein [Bacilli bacterium]
MENIKGRYIYSKDYRNHYVSGVFGGIGSRGEINMRFFLEEIRPMEKFNTMDDKPMDTELIREFCTEVTVTLDAAKAIYEWLGSHIIEAEEQQETLIKTRLTN